jgi:hypothetical protein
MIYGYIHQQSYHTIKTIMHDYGAKLICSKFEQNILHLSLEFALYIYEVQCY